MPTSPGPLYTSPTAPRTPKRSRSPSKGSSPKARRRVHFPEGSAVTGTLDGSDGCEADRQGRTGDSRDGTLGAGRSTGAGSTTEFEFGILCEP